MMGGTSLYVGLHSSFGGMDGGVSRTNDSVAAILVDRSFDTAGIMSSVPVNVFAANAFTSSASLSAILMCSRKLDVS